MPSRAAVNNSQTDALVIFSFLLYIVILLYFFSSQREIRQHARLYSLHASFLSWEVRHYRRRRYWSTSRTISESNTTWGFLLSRLVRGTKSLFFGRSWTSWVWWRLPRGRSKMFKGVRWNVSSQCLGSKPLQVCIEIMSVFICHRAGYTCTYFSL